MENLRGREDIASSFRDPSGVVFYQDGLIYRQVNIIYKEEYDHLMDSGLYKTFVSMSNKVKVRNVYLGDINVK